MNTIVVTKIARCLRHQLDELNCFNAAQRNTKSYNRKFLIQNIPSKTNIPSNRQISKESNRRHILGKKKKKKVLVRQQPDPFALHFILLRGPQYHPSMVNLAGFIRDSHIINLWSKQHHSRFICALQTPF